MIFNENDFLHGDTLLLTQRGLVAVKDISEGDKIYATDITGGLELIQANVYPQGRSGLYFNLDTSIGNIRLGIRNRIFTTTSLRYAIPADEFADRFVGKKVKWVSSPKYRAVHFNTVRKSLAQYYGFTCASGTIHYGSKNVVRNFKALDNSRQLIVSEIAKELNIPVKIALIKDGRRYTLPNITKRKTCFIPASTAEMFTKEECSIFMKHLFIFDDKARRRNVYLKTDFTLEIWSKILYPVLLCAIKAGFRPQILPDTDRYGKKKLVRFVYEDTQNVEIKSALVAQHEYEDYALYTPKHIGGVVCFVDGNMVILPCQIPSSEDSLVF